MVRGRYRVGVSKTKTKEKIMMKKKVMPLSCLMAAAMLAGCGTAAPAVPEETTAPAVETAEAAQETAPADAAESEAAAVEKTAGVWQVEPCYNFDEIVPLYSEWDHTAGKNAADGLYAVRDGERWSLFSTKTGNIMMQDAAQQMPYLYGTNELSVWLDDEYYNYDNFAAMREKCEGLNAELQANGAEIEVLYDGVGGYANRWIYTEDGQIYYDLLGTYEFSGTPLVQVSDASALFGVRPATWDNEYRCYTVANGAPYAVARSDGSLLSSFRYKNVCMAGDELIAVEDTDGNWGYCDINGEEVIPCTYQAAMQAEGASEPIDYPFPDMSGVVVVQDADGARMALYTDGTVCIEAGRFEDLAPAQGGCVWAKANGTWGIEYTTCQKCGYHNWTRKGNVYVCDTCGNETTTVVSANGVKGYVGNGAIAPIANKSAAPETRYATAKQAQDAADAREAAYAAAVVAFQKQIAANEAAYLAAIAK